MPVDRSVSGIRISERAEKRRPTSTPRPPTTTHRHPHRTRQAGRLPAHAATTARAPWDASTVTNAHAHAHAATNRRPVRSLTIALLLAAATVSGAVMAALAMGATPIPTESVEGDRDSSPRTTVTSELGTADGSAPVISPLQMQVSVSSPTGPAAATIASSVLVRVSPATGAPRSTDGPALVSTLAPGDPGFGWPASAFGSASPG